MMEISIARAAYPAAASHMQLHIVLAAVSLIPGFAAS